MSAHFDLLAELSTLGATVRTKCGRIVLRAGSHPIPAELLERVRSSKSALLIALRDTCPGDAEDAPRHISASSEADPNRRIIRWLNQHPAKSTPGYCVFCGRPETPDAMVLPFGTDPDHVWLHAECWPAWQEMRRREAITALGFEVTAN
jgi:hypothetical protein